MSMLSTSYDTHEFGRWDEWCHELMASVLPIDDPRMSVDDLSSPTWSIIFLKDDCFLQPSCEMNSSPFLNPDSLTNTITSSAIATQHHHYEEEMESTIPSSPSSAIEPLFDEIDLNHQQQQHQQNHQTQHTSCSDPTPCVESTGLNQPQSPTLSHSSSISLSDVDDQVPNRSPQLHASSKIRQQRKRKRQSKTKEQQQKNQKLEMTHKQYKHHGTTASMTTFFDQLSLAGINWCRYCGTTEGVNWRPGPWGKRTLCNKHGCDYKGYGLANRLPRLDLSDYRHELLEDRHRPVVQEFCSICQERDGDVAPQHSFKKRRHYQSQRKSINSDMEDPKRGDGDDDDHDGSGSNELIECDGGCSRAFHRQCSGIDMKNNIDSGAWMDQQERTSLWFCRASCFENRRRKRVFVDLPRKQPLMRS